MLKQLLSQKCPGISRHYLAFQTIQNILICFLKNMIFWADPPPPLWWTCPMDIYSGHYQLFTKLLAISLRKKDEKNPFFVSLFNIGISDSQNSQKIIKDIFLDISMRGKIFICGHNIIFP